MSEKNTPGVPGQDPTSAPNNPNTIKPAAEPDLLEEIAKVDASVIEAMPAVQRAAFRRELLSAIRRATWAAERLADLTPDEREEEPAPESEEDEGPVTEPARPYRRSLALLSDGRVAMSLAYVEGADLSGYERWEGIILEPDQAAQALDSMGDAAADVAGHLGGSILWKKDEPEGGDDE